MKRDPIPTIYTLNTHVLMYRAALTAAAAYVARSVVNGKVHGKAIMNLPIPQSILDIAPAAPAFLTDDDMQALLRFRECADDTESGGHDVPKATMRRLVDLGVLRQYGPGRHIATVFGQYILALHDGEKPALPLDTSEARHA